MSDLFLQAMMRGETISNKQEKISKIERDRFDIELEKQIDKEVDDLLLNEGPLANKFLSLEMKRKKLKEELKQSLELNDLSSYLETAIAELLSDEAKKYLQPEEFDSLSHWLAEALKKLETVDLTNSNEIDFKEDLNFSESIEKMIWQLAIHHYTGSKFTESLALFVFLATFNPADFEYWYRAGIVAQNLENFPLAIKFYNTSIDLHPNFIGAYVFVSAAYFECNQVKEAGLAINEAEKIGNFSQIDDQWKELIKEIKEITNG